ncbi:hypothetical protein Tco_1215573, partial [Tanacetum coccineum]
MAKTSSWQCAAGLLSDISMQGFFYCSWFLVLWEFIDGNDGGCCCGLSQDSVLENSLCSDYVRVLAQKALLSLKSIPVAARRSLPVLVNPEGQVISIPLYFQQLPVFE